MKLAIFIIVVTFTQIGVYSEIINRDNFPEAKQNSYQLFVGLSTGSNKALFVLQNNDYDWVGSMDYCGVSGMVGATIENEYENNMVVQFLNTTLYLPQTASFWLSATDFGEEGTFKWIRTNNAVNYSNWEGGVAPMNRSRNCLVINHEGYWNDEPCDSTGHFLLCEIPILEWGPSSSVNIPNQQTVKESEKIPSEVLIPDKEFLQARRLTPIGSVGKKNYFIDETNTTRRWIDLLTFCHEAEMRLVTPEVEEEENFLIEFTSEFGDGPKYFMTSGSDIITPNCVRGSTAFRWLYTGEEYMGITAHSNWYGCVYVTGVGLSAQSCIAASSIAICERTSLI